MFRTNKVLTAIFTTLIISVYGQGTNSPYSAFGIGELNNTSYAAFASMGGISVSNSDSTIVNSNNPASYVFFNRHQPVFQVGANGRMSWFSANGPDGEVNSTLGTFNLNQLQMGIPIKKNWGASIGVRPYSYTGYSISNYVYEDNVPVQRFTNEGEGGIRQAYLGVGFRVMDKMKDSIHYYAPVDSSKTGDSIIHRKINKLSLGVNGQYYFGSSTRLRTVEFLYGGNGFNSKVDNSLRISSAGVELGLNYEHTFSKRHSDGRPISGGTIAIGLTYSPRVQLRAYQDLFAYSYYYFGVGAEIINDTVEYVSDNQGTVTMPENYRFGLEYRIPSNNKDNSITRIGFEVNYQKWSAYSENFGSTSGDYSLQDRLHIGLGYEFTPFGLLRFSPQEKLFNRMSYRLGANYTITELNVNSTSLSNYGMSFGLGWPLGIAEQGSVSNTTMNFGLNVGRMGTMENNLIRETYLGMYFGISITPSPRDGWFYKRKYD